MELWFWLAVGSAVMSGVAGFTNKVAAHKKLDTGLIILYSGLFPLVILLPLAWTISGVEEVSLAIALISFLAGVVAGVAGIFKIHALRNIDTTIFYPIFKLLGPSIIIFFGIVFFGEVFSVIQWVGIVASLCVPLLLITKVEHTRQNNLLKGLWFLVLASMASAVAAGINKYAVDVFQTVLWIITFSSVGVFVGGFGLFLWENSLATLKEKIQRNSSRFLMGIGCSRGVILSLAYGLSLYAMYLGGPLGIVYTIQSLYILIPIVLAIIYYDEHWNTQKVIAIVFSLLALVLLG